MWAGGSFEWNPASQLSLDKQATQSVSVGGVSVKNERMMFVRQLREVAPAGGEWAIREERNHVFQPNEVAQDKPKPKAKPSGKCGASGVRAQSAKHSPLRGAVPPPYAQLADAR